jgi:hypothetical protein
MLKKQAYPNRYFYHDEEEPKWEKDVLWEADEQMRVRNAARTKACMRTCVHAYVDKCMYMYMYMRGHTHTCVGTCVYDAYI